MYDIDIETDLNQDLSLCVEKYKCTGCKQILPRSCFHEFKTYQRERPVTSRCKKCRRDVYYKTRYKTVCICCLKNRPLNTNNQCRTCNENMGLRQCKVCNTLLPLYMCFYASSCVCKTCTKNSKTQ